MNKPEKICTACEGDGWNVIKHTSSEHFTEDCGPCKGTGRIPIEMISSNDTTFFNCIHVGRRVGNTTRQIDLTIQYLFQGVTVMLFDHIVHNDFGGQRGSSLHLLDRIIQRMWLEHSIAEEDMNIDRDAFTINIKNTQK